MTQMKWFRLYSEMLHDRKIARIARYEQVDKTTVLGIWVSLLCIANDSPERGALMIGKDLPMTMEEIADELSIEEADFIHVWDAFINVGMLVNDSGCFHVASWNKRQFKSDSSNERVKRFRNKNVDETVTLQKRYSNALESDTDTESDTEKIIMTAPAADYAELLQIWKVEFPNKPQPRADNKTLQGKLNTRMKSKHFQENWKQALIIGGKSQFLQTGDFFTLGWFLKNDDHYERCLNGNYKDRQSNNHQPQHNVKHAAGGI